MAVAIVVKVSVDRTVSVSDLVPPERPGSDLILFFRLEDRSLQQPVLEGKAKIIPSIEDDRDGWRLGCIRDGARQVASIVFA